MTITISYESYCEIRHEVPQTPSLDESDVFDITWEYPSLMGKGYVRGIELTEGLYIEIVEVQIQNRLLIKTPEIE